PDSAAPAPTEPPAQPAADTLVEDATASSTRVSAAGWAGGSVGAGAALSGAPASPVGSAADAALSRRAEVFMIPGCTRSRPHVLAGSLALGSGFRQVRRRAPRSIGTP